jgi:hypothetical protein
MSHCVMASGISASASSAVSASQTQPGKSGTQALKPPPSSDAIGSTKTE